MNLEEKTNLVIIVVKNGDMTDNHLTYVLYASLK